MGDSGDPASRLPPAPHVGSTLHPTVVQTLARAQFLVDSRPPGPYQAQWCAEALMVGGVSLGDGGVGESKGLNPHAWPPRSLRRAEVALGATNPADACRSAQCQQH